jgi:hypothetical protein
MIATVGTSQPSLPSGPANTPGTQPEPDEGEATGAEEARLPSAQEVAERVYRLFCQDLRQMRERQGRW